MAVRRLRIAALFLSLFAFGVVARAAEEAGEEDGRRPALKRPIDVKIQLGDSELAILDLRPREAYEKSHIPGAVHADIAEWKAKSLASDGLDDLDWWAKKLGSLGVATTSQVLVYGEDPPEAARAWWLLRYLGVQHASILDGGFARWKQAGGRIEWDEFPPEERTFVPAPEKGRFCPLPKLRETVTSKEAKVLDVRSPQEYGGEREGGTANAARHSGHVPGAANLGWSELLQPDGTYKDPETIRELLKEKGISPDDAVVVHCHSGGRASAAVFALELAGFESVANYYPGWSEYGAAMDLPAEQGNGTDSP
ncbi:MAG TPA: rhodanese-like domain-containing protein [Pirellulaceae bacterium]|jgi:thiosulfate/3-mercaptopyruvate sulfurtransferase|nr:rhodanese-like domain-containing protein [Pirellulaceae bacterium]